MPTKKLVLPVIGKIKAYGEADYIEVIIDKKRYQMSFTHCMDTIDSMREANDVHAQKKVIAIRKRKELEQSLGEK